VEQLSVDEINREYTQSKPGENATADRIETHTFTSEVTWEVVLKPSGRVLAKVVQTENKDNSRELHAVGGDSVWSNDVDEVASFPILEVVWADLRYGALILINVARDSVVRGGGSTTQLPGNGQYFIPAENTHDYTTTVHIRTAKGATEAIVASEGASYDNTGVKALTDSLTEDMENSTQSRLFTYLPSVEYRGGAQVDSAGICMTVAKLEQVDLGEVINWTHNYITDGDLDELSGVSGENPRYWPVIYLSKTREKDA